MIVLHDPVSLKTLTLGSRSRSHGMANQLHNVEMEHGKAPNDGEEGSRGHE